MSRYQIQAPTNWGSRSKNIVAGGKCTQSYLYLVYLENFGDHNVDYADLLFDGDDDDDDHDDYCVFDVFWHLLRNSEEYLSWSLKKFK